MRLSNNFVHCHRNYRNYRNLCFNLFVVLTSISLSGTCIADDINLQAVKGQLVQVYEKAAFPIAGQPLIRMAPSAKTAINVVCKTGKCADVIARATELLPDTRFSVTASELGFSPQDKISLIVLDGVKTDLASLSQNGEFKLLPGEKVSDQGGSECHGVQFRIQNLVTRIIVAIDDRLPEKTTSFCILYQLMANSGLRLQSDYQTMKSQIAQKSDVEMGPNFKGMSRLIALHFWSESKPGMTREEFESRASANPLKILIGE